MAQGMSFGRNVARKPAFSERAFCDSSTQAELFPLQTLVEIPDVTHTADAWGKVLANDTHWYFVKGEKAGPNIRASE
jgi:hypothetical protein